MSFLITCSISTRLNSGVRYMPYHLQLDSSNALQLIKKYPFDEAQYKLCSL